MDSERVSQEEGKPLFQEDGNPSEEFRQGIEFVKRLQGRLQATEMLMSQLAGHDLMQPVVLGVRRPGGRDRRISGGFSVDEKKLNALPAETFIALRDNGLLPLIYMHLLSLRQMEKLAKLAPGDADSAIDPVAAGYAPS